MWAPLEDSVPRTVIGDPVRLRQALLNLLSNAIKFTDAGEVVLSVSREAMFDPECALLRFEIRDTGIGISPETKSKLFQSFSQADNSTTRRFGGTGLGLVICKRLIELMGGEIGVRTAVGSGSTFWFTVPFRIARETLAAPAAVGNLANRRVLAVDDNGTNRSVLKQQLGRAGMIVTCAIDGQEALEELKLAAFQNRPYELGILDLHMPVMNGLGLAKAIRAEPTICSTPLMMLTSDRDRDEAATARELGVKIFLVKPVKLANLVKSVGEMFGSVAVQPRAAAAGSQTLAGRVLVVEDNPINRKVIVLRLEKLGCTVRAVVNGSEAVDAANTERFDLILMDCQMPVMDGFQATTLIRGGAGRRIPIIALTANAMDSEREHCLKAGMDDYLSKPVRIDQLQSKLRQWIGADSTQEPSFLLHAAGEQEENSRIA